MDQRRVDVAIIGAGTAGLNARREVEKAGKTHVLIESGPYGTTCARVGCMPSKLLIAAADAAEKVRRAERFGVRVSAGWHIDSRAVMQRVRSERDRFVSGVLRATERLDDAIALRGHARFVGPTTLRVDDHTEVEAKAVVIASGSHPWIPPQLEGLGRRVLVNDDLFDLEELPASVAVFGTGIIGLELGQALHRLGVAVSFFNPFDEVGFFTDPEVRAQAKKILGDELDLHLQVETEVEPDGDALQVSWTEGGQPQRRRFARALAAAGRRPNLAGMNLEAAGLELTDKGVPVHDETTMRCGDSAVFIAGDVCGHRPVLHEASDEGRIAGHNAAHFPEVVAHERRASLAIAFTEPQMALVGERHADLAPDRTAIGEVSYHDQGRARVMGLNRGLVRVYADSDSCALVGAEMFGPRVEHMAHLLAWAVAQRMRVDQALRMPFYHPVTEEGLRTALRNCARQLQILDRCRPEDRATSPGT